MIFLAIAGPNVRYAPKADIQVEVIDGQVKLGRSRQHLYSGGGYRKAHPEIHPLWCGTMRRHRLCHGGRGNCRNREIRQLSPPDFLYLSIGASSVAVMIVVTIMVMVMGADTDTDRTDMDTDDGGASGGGAQQSQGENSRNKRFHDNCLS